MITKRMIDPDGTEITETIVKKGKAAEDFDIDTYIRENRGENVELDVRVQGGDDEKNIVIRRARKKTGEWLQDLEDNVNYAIGSVGIDGNRPFLGVQKDSDEDPDQPGMSVQIVRGSAADKAGLRSNDVILKLNDTDINKWEDITTVMKAAQPGDKIRIDYTRNGKAGTVEAELTRRNAVKADPEALRHGFLGVTQRGNADSDMAGVVIGVVEDSGVEEAGLQDDDVLLQLNDTPINDWEDITDFMDYTKPGESVQVTYSRNGQQQTTTVVLGEPRKVNWEFDMPDLDFDIKVREKEACLGVYTSAFGEGEDQGAKVSDFTSESAAREAEMATGDVITAVNGIRVKSHDQLWDEIAKYQVGDEVSVDFLRENQSKQVNAQLKACKDNSNKVMLMEMNEAGGDMQREFFLWNWDPEDQNRLRERRVITIHRGAEGDAPKVDPVPAPQQATDRTLQLDGFRAYPNPSQGQVTVEFHSTPDPVIVSLLDMSGRQLFREELNAFNGDYFQQFDLSEYAKGTVIIHVLQNGKVFTEQLIVN